jgi:hypothetical protein
MGPRLSSPKFAVFSGGEVREERGARPFNSYLGEGARRAAACRRNRSKSGPIVKPSRAVPIS